MEAENRKYTILTFLGFAALVGFIFFEIATVVADWMRFGGSNILWGYSWTVVGGAASGLVGLIFFISLLSSGKATSFFDEVFGELKKTTWPTGKETGTSTLVVGVTVIFAAIVLFVLDYLWGVLFRVVL